MLNVYDGRQRYGRRDFLKIGSLALGGLSLTDLLAAREAMAAAGHAVTDKAVIFLFILLSMVMGWIQPHDVNPTKRYGQPIEQTDQAQ